MDYLSHTPPSLPKGSLNPGPMKRMRAGTADTSVRRSSMSEPLGRLRAASDLCDDGVISIQEKGMIKDMIVNNDPRLTSALEKYERGDMSEVSVPLRDMVTFRFDSSQDIARQIQCNLQLKSLISSGAIDMTRLRMGGSMGGGRESFAGMDLGDLPMGDFDMGAAGFDGADMFGSTPTELTGGVPMGSTPPGGGLPFAMDDDVPFEHFYESAGNHRGAGGGAGLSMANQSSGRPRSSSSSQMAAAARLVLRSQRIVK